MVEFEDLIAQIGEFGWYQAAIFFPISILFYITASSSMVVFVFAGFDPGYTCTNIGNKSIPAMPDMTTTAAMTSTLLPLLTNVSDENATTIPKCDAYNRPCAGISFNEELTSVVTEFHLVCGEDYVTDTILSIQMAGVAIGSAVFGQLSDTFGRKKPMFVAMLCLCATQITQSFMTTWIPIAALRFFTGMGIGGIVVVGYVYSMEFIGAKYRRLNHISGWSTGYILLVGYAYFIRDWRKLLVTVSIPGSLLLPALLFYIPESPRWLLAQRRYDELKPIVETIAKRNKKEKLDFEKFVENYEKDHSNVQHEKYAFWDLFRTPFYTATTLRFVLIWLSLGIYNYAITFTIRKLPGDRYLNYTVRAVAGFAAQFLPFLIMNRFGRRIICLVAFAVAALAAVSVVVIYLLDFQEEYWLAVITCATIGTSATSAAWTVMYLMVSETFPTSVRDVGLGIVSVSSRVGGILAPQLVYLARFWETTPFVVSGGLALLAFVMTYFQQETKGKALKDNLPDWEWCFCCRRKAEKRKEIDDKIDIEAIK